MSLLWTIVILLAVNAATIGAMLLVRRRAPEGSYFKDGDRASGRVRRARGRLRDLRRLHHLPRLHDATTSRAAAAEAEALTVIQQFETAELLPPAVRDRLTGEMVCYATLGRAPGVAADGGRKGRRHDQPLGDRPLPEPAARGPEDRQRAGRVQEVARPDDRTARRAGAIGSTARRASSRPRSGSS